MSELVTTAPAPSAEAQVVEEARRPAPRPVVKTEAERLMSVDAYRGFVMLAMVTSGLGLAKLKGDANWGWLEDQFSHRDWAGCTFWDLIQPSFMFLVGVSMPFAYAAREKRGDSWARQFGHAVVRALLLTAIGVFLDVFSSNPPEFYVQFIRVLQQIALGYLVAFLVLRFRPEVQGGVALLLLVGHTVAYLIYGRLTGTDPWHQDWGKDFVLDPAHPPNVGVAIDLLLGTKISKGGYVAFNFVSSAATILFGVLAGRLLRSDLEPQRKIAVLVVVGAFALDLGAALGLWQPMIKRIWTASFAIFAAGWTCLMLAAFFSLIDGLKWRRWAWPFTVVGLNSIAAYVMAGTLQGPIKQGIKPLILWELPHIPDRWQPVQMSVLVTLVLWLFCLWLYRRKIFFKV